MASQAPGGIVVLALFLAGLGIPPLYPVLLAELVDVLAPAVHRGATLGALASGVALVLGPQAFAMIGSRLGQRIAFLLVLPLLLPVLTPWVSHPDWRQAK